MSESFCARLILFMDLPGERIYLECGGKRSATPLWIQVDVSRTKQESQAPSPLRSAGALQKLIRNAHLPEHERVIERGLPKRIVASRRAAVSRAHIHFQNQRIAISLELANLRNELCAFPVGNLAVVQRNLHEHRRV